MQGAIAERNPGRLLQKQPPDFAALYPGYIKNIGLEIVIRLHTYPNKTVYPEGGFPWPTIPISCSP
jgi:hypothetical protein